MEKDGSEFNQDLPPPGPLSDMWGFLFIAEGRKAAGRHLRAQVWHQKTLLGVSRRHLPAV